MEWNKGDYVLCIDNKFGEHLKVGASYKIKYSHSSDTINIEGFPTNWLRNRFIYLGKSKKLSRVEKLFYNVMT